MDKAFGPLGRRRALLAAAALVVAAGVAVAIDVTAGGANAQPLSATHAEHLHTTTPIKHVVVVFGENIAFDHYFGTYPNAANTDGTPFQADRHTPKVNGLTPRLLSTTPTRTTRTGSPPARP